MVLIEFVFCSLGHFGDFNEDSQDFANERIQSVTCESSRVTYFTSIHSKSDDGSRTVMKRQRRGGSDMTGARRVAVCILEISIEPRPHPPAPSRLSGVRVGQGRVWFGLFGATITGLNLCRWASYPQNNLTSIQSILQRPVFLYHAL